MVVAKHSVASQLLWAVKVLFHRDAVEKAVKAILDFSTSRLVHARDAVLQGVFPASPLSLLVIGSAVAAATLCGDGLSFRLSNWAIHMLQ